MVVNFSNILHNRSGSNVTAIISPAPMMLVQVAFATYTVLPIGALQRPFATILRSPDTTQYQVKVVGHGMALDMIHFLLLTYLTDKLFNFATVTSIKNLLAVHRDEHNMLFAHHLT